MPPKKRGPKVAQASSTPSKDASNEVREEARAPVEVSQTRDEHLSNAWTDEQETALFKSMIRWKPVGMHKHFRMISISENLKNYNNGASTTEHIRIPGIWKKLESLYNLEALDVREDAFGITFQTGDEPSKEPYCPFTLPDDEYWEATFGRRIASEGSSSPPTLSYQLTGTGLNHKGTAPRHSTVEDTDDPRSPPASLEKNSSRKTRATKGTRASHLAEVSTLGGAGESKNSTDQGTEDDQKADGNEDVDRMDVDEDDGKQAPSKAIGKASKTAIGKGSMRRSGRRR